MSAESLPSPNKSIRVAVVSDPHFFVTRSESSLAAFSYIRLGSQGDFVNADGTNVDPWLDLQELIKREGLAADLLACPGDITYSADDVGLCTAWREMNNFGSSLGAQYFVCATGNHDVRSRSMADLVEKDHRTLELSRGIFESLKLLDPIYPIVGLKRQDEEESERLRTQYFGDAFTLFSNDVYRILVINSCSEHGHDKVEYESSTFPKSSLSMLKKALEKDSAPKINICICHHPPAVHAFHNLGSLDFIINGQEILKYFEEHGSWIVIHGHKHHGHISYAQGGASSPIIFSAASLAAYLEASDQGRRNQFYILNIEQTDTHELRGCVDAWDWFQGKGWVRASRKFGGIFDGCGFGYRRSINQFAAIISQGIKLPCKWEEIVKQYPDINFLTPQDSTWLDKRMRTQHNVAIEPDENGNWDELTVASK